MRARRIAAILFALALLASAGCGDSGTSDEASEATTPKPTKPTLYPRPTVPPTTVAPTTVPPATVPPRPVLPEGRPVAAADPAGLAEQLQLADQLLRDPGTPQDQLEAAAHLQQVAYRQLGRHAEWDADVLAKIPAEMAPVVQLQADARRQFMAMHTRPAEQMPAWEIVAPDTAENLLAYYQEAQATFGVPWQYLAAINLVETGMGRIRGLSVAGAQGPMQFMPATWAAYGEGDVNAPRDAILAAGRYLAANDFATDPDHALFRYNNHVNYVAGVKAYASILELDAQAFTGLYRWQVYYASVAGDIWLPVGYALPASVPVIDWLAANPQ